MDKHEALERLAAIEVETAKLRKIIEADAATPDPRRAWIGKWGFYSDADPECPDDGFMHRLAGLYPGHEGGDFRLRGVQYRYFRPATPEELGVPTSIEPDWSEAPEWAQYWAVDEDGSAWWYAEEPSRLAACWNRGGREARMLERVPGWRNTLHKRPEPTK